MQNDKTTKLQNYLILRKSSKKVSRNNIKIQSYKIKKLLNSSKKFKKGCTIKV